MTATALAWAGVGSLGDLSSSETLLLCFSQAAVSVKLCIAQAAMERFHDPQSSATFSFLLQ